jgi:3alpha(or 20beta)-hydroxysteroid dehydrogenase
MGRLTGKVALLTGGARGMGEVHARRLVAEGAELLFTDIDEQAGEVLADSLGATALFEQQDIASETGWERIVARAGEHFGGIDILVNNAGIHSYGSFEEETVEGLRRVLDVNAVGTWLGIQKVAPVMRERGGGSIINLSSMVGLRGLPGYSVYGASKWAVRGITRHAAAELGAYGIRVNAILPGAIDETGMFNSAETPELEEELVQATPLRRFGRREDVSDLVVFLASDESAFMTGTDQLIDGGRSI